MHCVESDTDDSDCPNVTSHPVKCPIETSPMVTSAYRHSLLIFQQPSMRFNESLVPALRVLFILLSVIEHRIDFVLNIRSILIIVDEILEGCALFR